MRFQENVSLAALTTLKVGGVARYVALCPTVFEVRDAIAFAREEHLPWRMIGEGSNVLASDDGFPGVLIRLTSEESTWVDFPTYVDVTVDGGASWDPFVQQTVEEGLWGLENLAGIPGTVGAAPVQNIGAYGVEVGDRIVSLEVYNTITDELSVWDNAMCQFGYRESMFKRSPELIIMTVTFRLDPIGSPMLAYKDLAVRAEAGESFVSSYAVAEAVREIRSAKFPDLRVHGSAGSFFKNPILTHAAFTALATRFPDMPSYPAPYGVKIPLAYVLDKVLGLRGHRSDAVALFHAQPLVLVTDSGASATSVDMFAHDIATRVYDATGITIEREVRSL